MSTSVAFEYLRNLLYTKAQIGYWEYPPDHACIYCELEQDKRKTCKDCGRSDCVKSKIETLREEVIRLRKYYISETGSRKAGIKEWKAFLKKNNIMIEFDKNYMPIPSTVKFKKTSRF